MSAEEFTSEVVITSRKNRKAKTRDDVRNWPARIAMEEPLYRRAFQSAGARRVAVFSAGTAQRARLFARWGMSVMSISEDGSEIPAAEDAYKADSEQAGGRIGQLTFHEGSILDLPKLVGAERVETIVCVDDIVTRVDELGSLRENLQALAESLMAGGVLILATRNYPRLTYMRERLEAPIVAEDATGTRLFTRVLTYDANAIHVHVDDLTLVKPKEPKVQEGADDADDISEPQEEELSADAALVAEEEESALPVIPGEWQVSAKRETHVSVSPDVLKNELVHTGFDVLEVAGGYDGRRFALMEDETLLLVARRKKPRTTVHLDR